MREPYDWEIERDIEEHKNEERLEALEKFLEHVRIEISDRNMNDIEELKTAIEDIMWEIECIDKM